VPLQAPIQHWFFRQSRQIHPFNQAVLLKSSNSTWPIRAGSTAVAVTPRCPPPAVRQTSLVWQRLLASPDRHLHLWISQLGRGRTRTSSHRSADHGITDQSQPGAANASCSLRLGCPCASPLAAHHPPLGRGWRLFLNLLEDLQTAYQQLSHAKRRCNCRQDNFVSALSCRACGYAFSTLQQRYWRTSPGGTVEPAVDYPGATTLLLQLSRHPPPQCGLDPSLTAGCRNTCNLRSTMYLLAALGTSFCPMDGQSLSPSGSWKPRTGGIFDDVDVSRTVGWFTLFQHSESRRASHPGDAEGS